jgi:hypothetical protein
VVTAPVSLRDLPATITDLLGLAAHSPLPGGTLRRFWTDPPDTMPMPIFSELRHAARQPAWYPTSGGDMLSVIDGGMRYVRGGDGSGSAFALSDSLEASNLVGSGAEDRRVGQLRALVDSVRPRTP